MLTLPLVVLVHASARPLTPAQRAQLDWHVWHKTLTDPQAGQVNFEWVSTTVRAMRKLERPAHLSSSRIAPVELQSYRIDAELVTAILEKDSDIHLVTTDADQSSTRKTMIVELPDPGP